jgi:hypothetical protein
VSKTKTAPVPAPTKAPTKAKGGAPAKPQPEDDVELEGLMSEIEEDLREDELKKIWEQHGSKLVAGLVVVIAVVLGWQYWRQGVEAERQDTARTYDQAARLVVDGKPEEAITAYTTVAGKRGKGFAVLAQLQKAALLAQKPDLPGALAAYNALIEDTAADPLFRDLATVLYAMHGLDTEDAAALEARLAPMLNRSNAFYHSAVELTALLANKRGDPARAASLIEQLVSDPEAPGGVRARAQELLVMFKSAAAGGAAAQ